MSGTCRSCGAEVWWATTTGGKRMPVDLVPDQGGNLVVVDEHGTVLPEDRVDEAIGMGWALVTVARRGPRMMDPEHRRWRSHFATCPNAINHRKR